jgi:hypothetical protein
MTDGQAGGDDEELDLEGRQLCPDDACIGVIGADGRCGECGRWAVGGHAAGSGAVAVAAASQAATKPEPEAGWEDDRRLCPDGACIGLIGPDGTCKLCGRHT